MVKNPPYKAGDAGSVPGWGTKIPRVVGQLRPHVTTGESGYHNERAHVTQLRLDAADKSVNKNILKRNSICVCVSTRTST